MLSTSSFARFPFPAHPAAAVSEPPVGNDKIPAQTTDEDWRNYDVAERNAQHAEDLASKEGSLNSISEAGDFGQLALDLTDNGSGIKSSVV